jgi:hypothetical protein
MSTLHLNYATTPRPILSLPPAPKRPILRLLPPAPPAAPTAEAPSPAPAARAPAVRIPEPLKIGIHRDIIALGLAEQAVADLMTWWVNQHRYRRATVAGACRHGLDGAVAGKVTKQDAKYAEMVARGVLPPRFRQQRPADV